MKRFLPLLTLTLASSALACPRYSTLFNGTVQASMQGLMPFCSEQGRFWQARFTSTFKDAGATVHYVEVYKANLSASGGGAAWENATRNFAQLLGSIGYRYEAAEDLPNGVVFTFHKANTEKRHIALIFQQMDGFEMVAIVNMDMPFGHRFDQ